MHLVGSQMIKTVFEKEQYMYTWMSYIVWTTCEVAPDIHEIMVATWTALQGLARK